MQETLRRRSLLREVVELSRGGTPMDMRKFVLVAVALTTGVVVGSILVAQQRPNPRQQPGAMVHIFAPEQHDLYDGQFVISANRIYMVGGRRSMSTRFRTRGHSKRA
jgi:hypothetical protein